MLPSMEGEPKRLSIIFDADEVLRRAIKMRAAERGRTASEAIADILRTELAEEIEKARRSLAAEQPPPKTRRGPKPRNAD